MAAGVALLALVFYLAVPRAQPATGTLVVALAGKTDGSLSRSALMVHGGGQWVSLGDVSGAAPAAPAERDLTAVSLPAGAYDAVRLGGDIQRVSITVTAGQVEPLLLGVDSGHLITGSAYAGNDEVNLGLGELSGKFVAMPNYDLTDQTGLPLDPVSTAGKDLVIAAFNTTCLETCPLYAALFFEIEQHMPAGVLLLEVTTDPATDTPGRPQRLRAQDQCAVDICDGQRRRGRRVLEAVRGAARQRQRSHLDPRARRQPRIRAPRLSGRA